MVQDDTRKSVSEPAPTSPQQNELTPRDVAERGDRATAAGASGPSPHEMEPFPFPGLPGTAVATQAASLDLLRDVELEVRIVWGRAYLEREAAQGLDGDAIVPLDKAADEPVDVFVGGRLIARGEVVALDGKLCVRITELVGGIETL